MPNIVNAGLIALVAGFAAVAAFGAVDQFDVRRAPASAGDAPVDDLDPPPAVSLTEPDDRTETDPSLGEVQEGPSEGGGKASKDDDGRRDGKDRHQDDDRREDERREDDGRSDRHGERGGRGDRDDEGGRGDDDEDDEDDDG